MARNHPLDDEQLFNNVPSIFAQGKHISRSERYKYIPTIEIVKAMRQNGLFPFMAVQSRSRTPEKSEFTKHMIRFRSDKKTDRTEAFEVILINSHDGTSSYQLKTGVFRFACLNGMVVGNVLEDLRIPHKGNIKDNVVGSAFKILEQGEEVEERIDNMKSLKLLPSEEEALAEAALTLKYKRGEAPITASQLLIPKRWEDEKQNNLWGAFNRIQENITKGGLKGRTSAGKKTTTRAIKSIDNNVKLNEALWLLASKMAEIKNTPDIGI